jgi:hypothetical protein
MSPAQTNNTGPRRPPSIRDKALLALIAAAMLIVSAIVAVWLPPELIALIIGAVFSHDVLAGLLKRRSRLP